MLKELTEASLLRIRGGIDEAGGARLHQKAEDWRKNNGFDDRGNRVRNSG
jgi:hypothetical protein